MTRRKDGRWQHYVKIEGSSTPKYFYSSMENEDKAWKDIQTQMINFQNEEKAKLHNFLKIAEAMLSSKEQTVSYATYNDYKYGIEHLKAFHSMDIENITPKMLQKELDNMASKNYSFSAVSKAKTTFGLTLKYAIVEYNLQIVDFMSCIKIPKTAKKGIVHSPDDEVIEAITQNATTQTFGMWAMCFLCTGARRGELNAIQKQDIDFENSSIKIWRSVEFISNQPHLKNKPKTDSSIREAPILDLLKPLLQEMVCNLKPTDFIFGIDKPLTKSAIRRRWEKYCKQIGFDFNGHQLRHAYAKLLYRAGVDVKTAQGLLGHANIETTMNIYTEFDNEVNKREIIKINNLFNLNYK